jgi:uncharacterized protein YlxW (UPF0749 family)
MASDPQQTEPQHVRRTSGVSMSPHDQTLVAGTARVRSADELRRIVAELNALADEQDRLARQRARLADEQDSLVRQRALLADELQALADAQNGCAGEAAGLDAGGPGLSRPWPRQRRLPGDPGS